MLIHVRSWMDRICKQVEPTRHHLITYKFRQLRRPRVRCEDVLFGHPMSVDFSETCNGCQTFARLLSANQNAVRWRQVFNGRAFGKELRVGQNLQNRRFSHILFIELFLISKNITWNLTPGRWLARSICDILSAAFTGTVLFSTTILFPWATSPILRAADSMYFKSAALPWNHNERP